MDRRALLGVLGAVFLTSCTAATGPLVLAPNSTLIVTRHADRDGENLNAKGLERARALVDAVDGFEISAIFAPGIQRNLDTAAPLSNALNLPVQRIPQEAPTAQLVRRGGGQTVIWVGNKGNITTIWEDLSLPQPAPLEYGDLFIVRSDAAGIVTIEQRRYGPL